MVDDILLSVGTIVFGIVLFILNRKKDPNYADRYGYRIRVVIAGIACIIVGAILLFRTLFYR